MKNMLSRAQIARHAKMVATSGTIEYDDAILKEPLDVQKIREFYEAYFIPNWKSDYLFNKIVCEM